MTEIPDVSSPSKIATIDEAMEGYLVIQGYKGWAYFKMLYEFRDTFSDTSRDTEYREPRFHGFIDGSEQIPHLTYVTKAFI